MEDAFISVIIPVYNDAERLAACLDRIAHQTLPRERFEVIVVDNASEEPPDAIVEPHQFCRLTRHAVPGSYNARNHGMTIAKGDALAFTDSDCLPADDWLEQGLSALVADPSSGVVGGTIEVFAQDPRRPTAAELYEVAFAFNQEGYVSNGHWAATANMFTWRRVVDAVGPFDGGLKSGGDADFGRRAHAAGYRVAYAPRAVVRHPARQSVSQLVVKARRHAGGRVDVHRQQGYRFFRLHALRTAWRTFFPQFYRVRQARTRLRERGYGTTAWLKAACVVMTIQYTKAFELIRCKLGGASERM